jgi:hypothetical protein
MNLIEQLKALDDQRAKLIEDAKRAALEKAHKAVAELNELGFKYGLTDNAKAVSHRLGKGADSASSPKRRLKDAACPVCHFKTSPAHDGRSHRGQHPKRAFTAAELAEKHLTVV